MAEHVQADEEANGRAAKRQRVHEAADQSPEVQSAATSDNTEEEVTKADDAGASPTRTAKVLAHLRERLEIESDPHLQGRLLLQYSESAMAPEAETDEAIDYLFSFLQQHESGASLLLGQADRLLL